MESRIGLVGERFTTYKTVVYGRKKRQEDTLVLNILDVFGSIRNAAVQ